MHEYNKMFQWVKEGSGNRTISIEIGRIGGDPSKRIHKT